MTRDGRRDRALWLAAVAVLGLAVVPLLHAEQHVREEDEEEDELSDGGHHPYHSHGPAPSGEHGSGALAHLGLALHAAPRLPAVPKPAVQHAAPAAFVEQVHASLSYLVPRASQGPPPRCRRPTRGSDPP